MKEIAQIIAAYSELDLSVQKAALATVVHVEGSSYRRPGARMLITEEGHLTGAISGGCLEGDALRKALLVIHKGQAMVVKYDTTDEDDAKLGIGLGCNGIIHILIEPLIPGEHNPVELLKKLMARRQHGVLVTIFSLFDKGDVPKGTCALYTETGKAYSSVKEQYLRQLIEFEALEALRKKQSAFRVFEPGNHLAGFIEQVGPPISMVVIGAGNDVLPLTEIANTLGWKVTIIDGRASHATVKRFPLADEVIVSKPEFILEHVDTDDRTCFLLMTHNYKYDLVALKQLSGTGARYIGVLGPKKKMERMISDLGFNGPEDLPFVYGPVGLDIGAESPEEIALSIVAEIKAVFSGKDVSSLRYLPAEIHERTSANTW